MGEIKVVPLGAGQDVGRSCILVSMGGRNIMLDCGMHMGYTNERRFPDFSYITKQGKVDDYIDCVLISHFHLDHCGALPYLTEMVGYNGPVIMSHPTRAICPILLEDFRKVTVEREQRERKMKPDRDGGGENSDATKPVNQSMFTSDQIKSCMRKVRCINLHQVLRLQNGIEIKAYYAGHVLGAVMFLITVGGQSVLYTGDFNMTPDRHLGSAWVDRCRPDLLITESTYATTVRDSKRSRERDLLRKVHECVEQGGKVLIPVFALGRAQELCILLESYWDRMQLNYPMYFSVGLAEKANAYYKLFVSWTNEKIRETFVARNMFDFRHISPLQRGVSVDRPGGMVVFATPGMLHAGQSLSLFRKWAPDEKNMLIVPGYCVAGTVGWRVLNGQKHIDFPDGGFVDVRMRVEYLSFSAHADARGIMKLVKMCQPRNVMLVHGENSKMNYLQRRIQKEFGIDCVKPANGETATIVRAAPMIATCAYRFLKRRVEEMLLARDGAGTSSSTVTQASDLNEDAVAKRKRARRAHVNSSPVQPIALCLEEDRVTVSEVDDAFDRLGLAAHEVRFTSSFEANVSLSSGEVPQTSSSSSSGETHLEAVLKRVRRVVEDELNGEGNHTRPYSVVCNAHSDSVTIENSSVLIKVSRDSETDANRCSMLVSWSLRDELLGSQLMKRLKSVFA